MKIHSVKIKNFRGYKEEQVVTFDSLTVLVGKNDVGKSTILEALDIFFENRKIESSDKCILSGLKDYPTITVEFADLPSSMIFDEIVPATPEDEAILNNNGFLEIKKTYQSKNKIELVAYQSTNEMLKGLLQLKIDALRERANSLGIDKGKYKANTSSSIRKAIREHIKDDSEKELCEINIEEEGMKNIWGKIKLHLPIYALFQSDRKNEEKDTEIQDPLKSAAQRALKPFEEELDRIKKYVEGEVAQLAGLTIDKLKEMNDEAASHLKPNFPELKWSDLFKPTIESDGVPLNKRGSGVKRLILLSFFQAEAARKKTEKSSASIIYAIEEPETSQHPNWQNLLTKSLIELSNTSDTQVIVTTHSPELAGLIPCNNLRYLVKRDGIVNIDNCTGNDVAILEIAKTLGVLPRVTGAKVIICLEGPSDIVFINNVFKCLGFDIGKDERIVTLMTGGDTLMKYVEYEYLKKLNCKEMHIYDRDVLKYASAIQQVIDRQNGSWGVMTNYLEIENYYHPEIVAKVYPHAHDYIELTDNWQATWQVDDIPKNLNKFLGGKLKSGVSGISNHGSGSIKRKLAEEGSLHITKEHLQDLGVYEEVNQWVSKVKEMLNDN